MSERGSRFSCRRIVSSRTACRAFASSARRDGACTMTEQTDNLRDPPCPARIRGSNRRQSVGERLSLTVLMCAPPAAQPKLHRYGLALDRQILKASGVQPADFGSAVRNQGQMPNAGPAAQTTRLSSSVSATPKTFAPGPGDHFDLVCIP